MKKQILSMIAIVAIAATVFTGCKKKDDATPSSQAPTIKVASPTDTTPVKVGTRVKLDITVTAGSGQQLKDVMFSYTLNGVAQLLYNRGTTSAIYDSTLAANTTSFRDTTDLPNYAAGRYVITIKAVDKAGNSATSNIVYNIAAGKINTYTAVLMGAQNNTTLGSFYATSTNTVYLQSAAKTNASAVDFCFYYNTTPTIAAPADADAQTTFSNGASALSTWTVRNTTYLKLSTVSNTDFDAISDDSKLISEASYATATKVNSLALNSVFAFRTAAGKFGMAKVTQVDNSNTGKITLVVKVQQ